MTRSTGRCGWAVALVIVVALAGGGCGSVSGGAGKVGAPSRPTVLRMAGSAGSLDLYPSVQAFVDAVRRRSGGRLRIDMINNYGSHAVNAEPRIVRAVAAHRVDLGYVRTGVFDLLGVRSLQALSAPLLIPSSSVEQQVVAGDLGRTMLAGVAGAGVAGVALLPDQMRRPIGVVRPLRGPGDYRGLTFAAYPSRVTEARMGHVADTRAAGRAGRWL
jgi:TRAP-type C4-dicarboxylate transport system substrate-binding protein